MTPGKYFTAYPHLLILSIVWVFIQGGIWWMNPLYTEGEALRIIREAEHFNQGLPFSSPIYYTYLTEILLSSVSLQLGHFWLNYAVHLLLNLLALHCFYHLCHQWLASRFLAITGSALLLLCIPYQLYNTFIYTESVFFSLIIVYAYLLFRKGTRSGGWLAVTILVLITLCITRPTGVFIVAATVIYGFYRASAVPVVLRWMMLLLPLAGVLVWVDAAMRTGGGINVMEPFLREHIICDAPALSTHATLKLTEEPQSLYGLLYYIVHNFPHFLQLAAQKTMAFFGLLRPWYSTMHNILLGLYFYPLYLSIGLGLWRKKMNGLMVFSIALVMIHWIFVMMTCDEWHSRFFLTLTPFIILMALNLFKRERAR